MSGYVIRRMKVQKRRTFLENVLEADIKGRIRMGREGIAILAVDVSGLRVVVPYGVFDLCAPIRSSVVSNVVIGDIRAC